MSQRKALCIGIDEYPGADRLHGCVNDAKAWAALLSDSYSVRTLLNREATWNGIMSALEELISSSSHGQVLVVTFSGHGCQVGDREAQDEDDGLDEALCPIDFNTNADVIIDDDLGGLISELPDGVNLTFLLDCCHSGTMTREVRPMLRSRGQVARFKERFIDLDPELAKRIRRKLGQRHKNKKIGDRSLRDAMSEVLISACLPEETSKESGGVGLFSQAAIEFLRTSGPVTHRDFTSAMRQSVAQAIDDLGATAQTPALYCNPQDRDRLLFSRKGAANGPAASVGNPASGNSLSDSIANLFGGMRGEPLPEASSPKALATFLESLAALLRTQPR